jgi:RNA polymerase sigma-70 factor (ECF subfamily)
MVDLEDQALDKAREGNFTDFQLLLLESCEGLRDRIAGDMPADLRQLITVDDVIQEACVEAIRDIKQFERRGPGSFQSWLGEIARTCLLDFVRSHRRQKRGGHMSRQRISWIDVAEHVMCNPEGRSPVPTPSRIAVGKEVICAVQAAVSQLPENERRVMRLYYLEQQPTENIAAELNVSPGAVRATVQRARQRLRDLLGSSSVWPGDHG